ncbi:MAG: hypothetical protein HYZ18_14085 [Pseudogulbenkiania sp.]|nr:hypothetical protein [Pseudogulbenkiania sp.]
MNRTDRRAMAKAQRRQTKPRRRTATPGPRAPLVKVYDCFASIELVFDELRHGELTFATFGDNEVPVFYDTDRQVYQLIPAMHGWIDLWQTARDKWALPIELTPVIQLVDQIERDETLSPGDVAAAWGVIETARELYRNMNDADVRALVRTLQIKYQLEGTTHEDSPR